MRLDHEFQVPVSAAQAWPILLDIDRIAPCMPGATITKVDGDDFEGTVKVKVGPITVTYGGTASFLEKDESQRIAVIEARGKETRGSGTATARVTAQLFDEGATSRVAVTTDLAVTGKPAQFGRGVMVDVGNKLLNRFADCLAQELGSDSVAAPAPAPAGAPPASEQAGVTADSQAASVNGSAPVTAPAEVGVSAGSGSREPVAAAGAAAPAAAQVPAREPARAEAEPIDLFDAAGGAVAKRLVPVLGAAVVLAIVFAVLRRRK
ncbi:MAG TPA: SRPBCC family protein [Mycobacteriales bacterium]